MTKRNALTSDVVALAQMCAYIRMNNCGVTPKALRSFMAHSGYNVSLYKARKLIGRFAKLGIVRYDVSTKSWAIRRDSMLLADVCMLMERGK